MPDNHEYQAIMDGIKGIHDRLDVLNGRVYDHEKDKADKSELDDLEREVGSIRSVVWRISLVLAGAYGGVEAIKGLL